MKCDNCKKESQWLEIIGSNFICKRCISKHKILGLVIRTHMDTFRFIIRRLKPKNYEEMMRITKEQVEEIVNLKEQGIVIK